MPEQRELATYQSIGMSLEHCVALDWFVDGPIIQEKQKCIGIISILLHHSSQQFNSLHTIISIFLQAVRAAQGIFELNVDAPVISLLSVGLSGLLE